MRNGEGGGGREGVEGGSEKGKVRKQERGWRHRGGKGGAEMDITEMACHYFSE